MWSNEKYFLFFIEYCLKEYCPMLAAHTLAQWVESK